MVRRWFVEHPKAVDRTIAITYVVASLIGLFLVDVFIVGRPPGSLTVVGLLAYELVTMGIIVWMLLMRRTRPLLGFIVATALGIFVPMDSVQSVADAVAQLYLLYAVPVYASVRQGWVAYAIHAVANAIHILINADLFSPLSTWVATMLMSLVVLLIAINLGNRRRYIDALVERANYLERDRDQLARIAVAEERERIAREMHDIVAHSVSVMIALSEGAARSCERAPERAVEAMERSAETGRTALAEMRRLLGVLSEEGEGSADYRPQPGALDIAACVEEFRQTGLTITLSQSGTPPSDEGLGLAVYRIVQESLTNALRYAGPGATVEVKIRYGGETVIEVRDFGRMSSAIASMDNLGSGRGLQGLAERTRMFGGELRAGTHPDGGWFVYALLKTTGGTHE